MTQYRLADFFAGSGAFSLGFKGTGQVKTVFANDFDAVCKKAFDMNIGDVPLTLMDIHDVDRAALPEFDILCAGFNCQPYSIAGTQKGFEDERAQAFWPLVRIIEARQPKVFVLENVKNLVNHDEGRTMDRICFSLQNLGYEIRWEVLNTCRVTDVPQNRERVYILGFKDEEVAKRFVFPGESEERRPISALLEDEEEVDDKYFYSDRYKVWPIVAEGVVKNVYSENTLYQFRRQYVRENKNHVCPTLTCNMAYGGHNVPLLLGNKGIRKLTPRECLRFQGFPEDYRVDGLSDAAVYGIAGNAVSVGVVSKIARNVIEALNG